MTTGVWCDSIVAGVTSTGNQVAGVVELLEVLDARSDVVGPTRRSQREAIMTPASPGPDEVGSPLRATLPL